ncbi:signal-transducing adaptor protein 1-like [Acanthochromis polyacanthus]|uniref:Signal-transducing adaptor protein 1-like n=1 Tax=Acanthochromis polyacanthus TaxID=80966 RepID=A0A3Q1EMH8_9TELE|nr:signal-transducing adaptor protein 1-like [Acanthochromis polyacanthus]
MSMHPRVVHKRRETITALPLYHSGHLQKKLTKEKDFKKFYGELRGATLFLYKDDTQDTYTEKVDLEQLKSMELDSSYKKKEPTIFTLSLSTEELQLKMNNPDTGEVWRGFILTVGKKEIPSELQLLPGQMMQLKETLNQEKTRKPKLCRAPTLPPRPPFLPPSGSGPSLSEEKSAPVLPSCFFDVTRQEAEKMLNENPDNGSIILRPSTLPNNYALTLRQHTPSGPVVKNYRLTSTKSGFVIELETPVKVSSMNDVLKYFLEKTEYRLHPYAVSQPYDTRIEVSSAPKRISITSSTPKQVPKAQVAPMMRSKTKEVLQPPPDKHEDNDYAVPDDHDLKFANMESELKGALKLRRQNLYAERDQKEAVTYENHSKRKNPNMTERTTKNWTM